MTAWDRASEHDPDTGPRFHRAIPEPASLDWSDGPENAPLSLPCEACGEDHAPNERCGEVVPATGGYTAKHRAKAIAQQGRIALLEDQLVNANERIDRLNGLLADALERAEKAEARIREWAIEREAVLPLQRAEDGMSRLADIRARLDAAPGQLVSKDGTCYSAAAFTLIAHAPQDIADLLAVAEVAAEYPFLKPLREALARLDGDAS